MNIILLGPPGAGKGTQAKEICKARGYGHLSTGDLLRGAIASGSELGKQVESVMSSGALVNDELILGVVAEHLKNNPMPGFIFDGFPRTIAQAEALDGMGINIDAVVQLEIADEEIVERLSGRRSHPASGRCYHVKYNPPKVADVDDETGEPLVIREDDKPETIRHRLAVYHEQTKPLVNYYQSLAANNEAKLRYHCIDSSQEPAKVLDDILTALF